MDEKRPSDCDYSISDDTLGSVNRRRRSSICSFLYAPRNSTTEQQINRFRNPKSSSTSIDHHRAIEKAYRKRYSKIHERSDLFALSLREKLKVPWIEQVFNKRECIKYVQSYDNVGKCGCGLRLSDHSSSVISGFTAPLVKTSSCINMKATENIPETIRWNIEEHTRASSTDSFGTLQFSGGAHAHKAHYVRLSFDSDPADIMYLMEKVWAIEPPRLVITVHGGISNFEVQDKLGRVFRKGLLKAAQTTGAWIITAGIDAGVVRHVAIALDEAGISARMRSKIVTIGVAPWGLLKSRNRLIGKDLVVTYDSHSFASRTKYATLNDRHSYFLLVDNGTVGRYGADIILRKKLEDFIAQKKILGLGTRHVPVVCVVLEGGTCTIRSVLQYLTSEPPVPVIVCDGSGRASDLLSFASRHILPNGRLPDGIRIQLLALIATVFDKCSLTAEQLLNDILRCAYQHHLLTIFRLHAEKREDVDHAILTAMLMGQNLLPTDQLALTLAWNRIDIARSDIFIPGQHWSSHSLHWAMMEALLLDRVDFVELLLENGVLMQKFLTIYRLEQLYNMEQQSALLLIRGNRSKIDARITLPEIGLIVEKFMGNAYKCYYTSRKFKNKYENYRKKDLISRIPSFRNLRAISTKTRRSVQKSGHSSFDHQSRRDKLREVDFQYPFNDLMIWAVLSGRQAMARCMWMHGEEGMAKALTAVRLYKSMSRESTDEYIDVEVRDQLRVFAEEFINESLTLLNHCYKQDDTETLRLLTAELPNWGHHTCLSLAVIANNKRFLAHPCCQILLADLWLGGLIIKSHSNAAIILALILPPCILLFDVKSRTSHSRRLEMYSSRERLIMESEIPENIYINDVTKYTEHESSSSLESDTQFHAKKKKSKRKTSIFKRFMPTFAANDVSTESLPKSRSAELLALSYGTTGKLSRRKMNEASNRVSWTTKMVAFYSAPISTFWAWMLSFLVFLGSFTHIILVELPVKPVLSEWFLLSYAIAFAVELCRKLIFQEATSVFEKIRGFFDRCWNYLTAIAIITFFIGFAFRIDPNTRHTYGRVILSCDIVLWYMKVLDFMGVHPLLGPYIKMTGKMIINMMYIIALLLVPLMAFGISKQAITYPHEKWNWILLRNIFYKPYFMLYGEVYAGEIDTCGDEGINCVYGSWIPPILMTVFLLVANILLINMLIAIFNNIFNETNAVAQQVWLFERYQQVMEYENTPLLPPPFTPIAHIFSIFKSIWQKTKGEGHRKYKGGGFFDYSRKLCLNDEELRSLHDFEEDCMDDLSRKKLILQADSCVERNSERADEFVNMREKIEESWSVRATLWGLEIRLNSIERSLKSILKSLNGKESIGTKTAAHDVREGQNLSEMVQSSLKTPLPKIISNNDNGIEIMQTDQLQALKIHNPCISNLSKTRHCNRDYSSITDTINLSTTNASSDNESIINSPSILLNFCSSKLSAEDCREHIGECSEGKVAESTATVSSIPYTITREDIPCCSTTEDDSKCESSRSSADGETNFTLIRTPNILEFDD